MGVVDCGFGAERMGADRSGWTEGRGGFLGWWNDDRQGGGRTGWVYSCAKPCSRPCYAGSDSALGFFCPKTLWRACEGCRDAWDVRRVWRAQKGTGKGHSKPRHRDETPPRYSSRVRKAAGKTRRLLTMSEWKGRKNTNETLHKTLVLRVFGLEDSPAAAADDRDVRQGR